MAETRTPAPPHDRATGAVSYDDVTRTVARTLGNPGRGYYVLLGSAVTLLAIGIVCLLYLLRYGMGMAGYSMPTYWAVYITCFVFWVGIAHSGTLISAILFLFRSGWRTAVYRVAEIMTVFAVMTAGLFPLIHIGRQWFFYWLLPYPNERGLWPNFKSPLVWDEFAIGTYFTVSTCFLIMGLIPDIAAVRDVATGWRRKLYAITSLGWRGTNEQWRHYRPAYLYLAALATPLVLSVHSVVSWISRWRRCPLGTRRCSHRTSSRGRFTRAVRWSSRCSSRCASCFSSRNSSRFTTSRISRSCACSRG